MILGRLYLAFGLFFCAAVCFSFELRGQEKASHEKKRLKKKVFKKRKARSKKNKVTIKHKTILEKSSEHYEGKSQSPIDLGNAFKVDLTDIKFNYKPSLFSIKNTGHSIQLDSKNKESYIIADGAKYNLVQFHFHTPSEHTVNGKNCAMEIHFVHQNEQGNLAVVGVLAQEGAYNKFYQSFFKSIPKKEGEVIELNKALNLLKLFPKDKRFFRYDGSLTTKPFTEGVKWIVIKQPIRLSKDQIESLTRVHGENARSVQPINHRPVLFDTTIDSPSSDA